MLAASIVLTSTTAHAWTSADDTSMFYDHIQAIRNGTRTALDPRVYHVRGMIELSETQADDKSVLRIQVPSPLVIKGASSFSTQTRIVVGVSTNTRHLVTASDPLYNRFQGITVGNQRAYYVDVPGPYVGAWSRNEQQELLNTDVAVPGMGKEFHLAMPMHPQMVTFDYGQLEKNVQYPRHGELGRFAMAQPSTQGWWPRALRAVSASLPNDPTMEVQPFLHQMLGPNAAPLFANNTTATPTLMRAIVFALNDYSPKLTGVSAIASDICGHEITFTSPLLTGSPSTKFDSRQRVRLFNSPEFLDENHEYFIDPAHSRIYFIADRKPEENDVYVNFSQPLELVEGQAFHSPLAGDTPWPFSQARISPTLLLIRGNGGDFASGSTRGPKITVEKIDFDAGIGSAIMSVGGEDLVVNECNFANFGNYPIFVRGLGSVQVQYCGFYGGAKGGVYISSFARSAFDVHDMRMQSNLAQYSEEFANIELTGNVFNLNSMLYLSPPSIQIDPGFCNVRITQNSLSNLPGTAIRYAGADVVLDGNNIDGAVKCVTDAGAVYAGRSLLDYGNVVSGNIFSNIQPYDENFYEHTCPEHPPIVEQIPYNPPGGPEPALPPDLNGDRYSDKTGLKLDVSAIYWDDMMSAQTAMFNEFNNCAWGLQINGGRDNEVSANTYHDSGTILGLRWPGVPPIRPSNQATVLNNVHSDNGLIKPGQLGAFSKHLERFATTHWSPIGATSIWSVVGTHGTSLISDPKWAAYERNGRLAQFPASSSSFYPGTSMVAALMDGIFVDGSQAFTGSGWIEKGWVWLHRTRDGGTNSNSPQLTQRSTYVFSSDGNVFYDSDLFTTSTSNPKMVYITGKVQLVNGIGTPISHPVIGRSALDVHFKNEPFSGASPTKARRLLLDKDGNFVIAVPKTYLDSHYNTVFLRVAGALWKKYPVNNLMNALGTINLRYGDLDGNNEILTGTPVAPRGDGLVWDRSQTGFIAANNPEIYFYDHRADMSGNGTINDADFFILQDMVGTGNNLGDSLE